MGEHGGGHVTRRQMWKMLSQVDGKMDKIMTEVLQGQADADAAAAAITGQLADIRGKVADASTRLGTLATAVRNVTAAAAPPAPPEPPASSSEGDNGEPG